MPILNAPTLADLSMQRYYATALKEGGVAKAARYVVRITPPSFFNTIAPFINELMYLCETAEIPGKQFNTFEYRYYGPSIKAPYQTVYNELPLTFMCRDFMREKELFDTWLEVINPQNTYDFLYKSQYQTTIEIFTIMQGPIEGQGMASYWMKLTECFPTIIAPMPANFMDDQYFRLNVSFAYTNFSRPDLDGDLTPSTFSLINNNGSIEIRRSGGTTIRNLVP